MPDIQDYPQIYSAAGTRLAILDKAYDVIATDQIITDTNGASTLNFNLPLDDPKQILFDIEDEIHVAGDIFIIRTIQPGWDSSGTLVTQIYAEAKWYDLSGFDPIQPVTMTGATAISVMETLLQNTDWSPGVVDVTTVADFSLSQVTNPLAAIMGMPAVFGGELQFDSANKTVFLRQQIGGDNGLFYAFGKNLQSNQRTVDSRNLYTRMRPYGANDANNNPITISSVNGGQDYVENYSWFDSTGKPRKVKCYEQTNDKITDPAALKTWGQQILAQLCMPKITYTMQVVIDKNQGIPQIGDVIRVYDPKLKMTTTNRVAQRNYNVLQPWLTTVQLSTALYTSSDQTTAIANDVAVQMAQQKSFFQVAVDQATKDITGASGGYVRLNPSKNPSEILIMDTPDINTATKVWRWNSGGLGYSKNGYNGPYELAMTQSGQIVADFITTGILKAIEIQGVSISGSSYYMENGSMKIWLDQNGFHMFNDSTNMDVYIDGNGIRALKNGNPVFSVDNQGNMNLYGGTLNGSAIYVSSDQQQVDGSTVNVKLGINPTWQHPLHIEPTAGTGIYNHQSNDHIFIGKYDGSTFDNLLSFFINGPLSEIDCGAIKLKSTGSDAGGGGYGNLTGVTGITESGADVSTYPYFDFGVGTGGTGGLRVVTTATFGTGSVNYADIYYQTAHAASLAEFKQDIARMTASALDLVKALPIYRFHYKTDVEGSRAKWMYGPVIGSDYDPAPDDFLDYQKQGTDDHSATYLVAKAVQELSAKVDADEQTIATQQQTINDLSTRLAALEAKVNG